MTISQEDFQFISDILKKTSGIYLGEDKLYLVETRLTPIANAQGCESISDLINMIKLLKNQKIIVEIVEAMTTNETSFFRDIKPFEELTKLIIPNILKNSSGKNKIRIWSAASSTGQEAYSIAMILKENKHLFPHATFEIIGTDISFHAIEKAKSGSYDQFEIQKGLPVKLLIKYFMKDGNNWKLSNNIKQMVTFQQMNLLDDFSKLGKFDIVFCRNVLMYFDRDTKNKVLTSIKNSLNPKSFLILGASETMLDRDPNLIELENHNSIYQFR